VRVFQRSGGMVGLGRGYFQLIEEFVVVSVSILRRPESED
jgi:hypothetical protein